MSEKWFCKVDGQDIGPLDVDGLRELFHDGKIGKNDSIRSNEHHGWQRLARVYPEFQNAVSQKRVWYFASIGEEFGPFTFIELEERARRNDFGPTDNVREGKEGAWRAARMIPNLFPHADDLLEGLDSLADAPSPPPRSKPKSHADIGVNPSPSGGQNGHAGNESRRGAPSRRAERESKLEASRSAVMAWVEENAATEEPSPAEDSQAVSTVNSSHAVAVGSPPVPELVSAPSWSPPPSAPPRPIPPPPPKSTGGGGGIPDWLVSGKTIGIAAGVLVVMGVGWFLMGSNVFASLRAGSVYEETVVLYDEFKAASKNGAKSSEFQNFYKEFKVQQLEIMKSLGTPALDSKAFEVRKAIVFLGSVVEGVNREKQQELQDTYVKALEDQLAKLKSDFGS